MPSKTSNFVRDPRREATPAIRGYVYQVETTILRWLNLCEPQELELECGEDIDTIQDRIASGSLLSTRLMEQVKSSPTRISLRSPGALGALVSFLKHLSANPHCDLQFRYVTTAGVRSERASPFVDGSAGIIVWEDVRQGKVPVSDVPTRLAGIRRILQGTSKPDRIHGGDWRAFTEFARRASDAELAAFVRRFEWSMEQSGPEETRSLIIEKIQSRKPNLQLGRAVELYQRLFVLIFKTLARAGAKKLTPSALTAELSREAIQPEDRELWLAVRALLASLEERVARVEANQHDILAMLSQNASVQSIGALAPNVIIDPQPLVDKAVPRAGAVEQVMSRLAEKTWCALVGEHSCGKTQLAALVALAINKRSVWVRLRDRTPEEAAAVLDRCLEHSAQIPRSLLFERWYRRIVEEIGAGSLIVLDDLPSTASAGPLETRLVLLAKACEENGVGLISTSHQPLDPGLVNLLGETVQELQAAPFSDEDIAQLLQNHGAPKRRAMALSRLVAAITRRHAFLTSAAARFLSNKGWATDDETLDGLLRGDFAKILEESVRRSLTATTTEETRDLIYRLTLAGPGFGKEDVLLVAEAEPKIRLPLDKLSGALGLWVQRDSPGTYSTCALLDRLDCGLSAQLQRQVHLILGGAILRRKALSLWEGMTALTHYVSAGDLVTAAFILSRGLDALVNYEGPPPLDMGLTHVWTESPLPEEIPLLLRLQVRTLQIVVRHQRNMDVEFLLNDLEALLEQARGDDIVGVLFAGGLLTVRIGRDYPKRANAYILKMFEALPTLRLPGGEPPIFPEDAQPENMLWITARGIHAAEDLLDWLNTVQRLPEETRTRLFHSDVSDTEALLLCDGVWDRERLKPAEQQDWKSVFEQLDTVEEVATATSNTLLQGCVARSRVITHSEFRNAPDDAVAVAERSLPTLAAEPKAQFLLAESIAQQLSRHHRDEESRLWALRAIGAQTDAFPLLRRDALLLLSRTTLSSDPEEGVRYAEQGARLAKSSPALDPTTAAETLGELGIALWAAHHQTKAFEVWEEAISLLLRERSDSSRWRKLYVVFGHCTAYFSSVAAMNKPPTADFVEPYPGILLFSAGTEELYDPNREALFVLQVALFAEALGLPRQAAEWGARAADASEKTGGNGVVRQFSYLGVADAVLDDRYNQALELAYRSVEYGQPIDVGELQRLGIARAEQWETARKRALAGGQADQQAILIGLVPIAARIAHTFIDDREKARNLAAEAMRACLGLKEKTGRPIWETAAQLVAAIFEEGADWRQFAAKDEEFVASAASGLSTISRLGVVLHSSLAQSLVFQLSIFRFAEQFYWRAFRTISVAVLVPLVERFWTAVLNERSFELRMPQYTGREIRAAFSGAVESRVRRILRAATTDLNLTPGEDVRRWLSQA